MQFDPIRQNWVLSTGRVFYAHMGILGLAPNNAGDDTTGRLFYGFDSECEESFSPAERAEIARHMSGAWWTWAGPQPGLTVRTRYFIFAAVAGVWALGAAVIPDGFMPAIGRTVSNTLVTAIGLGILAVAAGICGYFERH